MAVGILLFAFTVEVLQYFKIVEVLGLEHSKLAHILIGTSFAWMDMLTYIVGFAIILIVEKLVANNNKKTTLQ
ncbi:ribosomal maturation YjgA family protein [Flavobacterium litorale]|uniref:DUF2809 domain-containing protein n=1 Tax=Flavobacterium litorale TaxID=2856519 RepID=A0ABX8V4S0_9FLAO|nr:DUF2809 domain-containing protein [Flavobacterium litorale]QYJ67834.1 DUF2809 domain-containing protein [Flavobacterium litorale]